MGFVCYARNWRDQHRSLAPATSNLLINERGVALYVHFFVVFCSFCLVFIMFAFVFVFVFILVSLYCCQVYVFVFRIYC